MRRPWAVALAAAMLLQIASARGEPVRGRVVLQDVYAEEGRQSLAAALDARRRNDVLGGLRLSYAPRIGDWTIDLADELSFDAGDTPRFGARKAALGLFPSAPPATWLDLTNRLSDRPDFAATQRVDRLSLGYSSADLVIRVGRQALTWGAGLVFRPMDLFDPFAPDATDTEYKPGTDMLYGQYLFGDGSDLQAVVVPRPAHRGGGLDADASSSALHFRTTIASLQATWLIARDHGDTVAGVGLNGAVGGATWNAELIPTIARGDAVHTSGLINISDAGQLWGRDVTYFGEYFRNGFGLAARRHALSALPAALLDRLVRGQVFNTGRDYLAAGARLQVTPLLQINPTLIANLNDRSLYALAEATYSLSDNLNLIVGAQLPIGPANSEFGGIAVTPNTAPFLQLPSRFYVQVRRYF